MTLPLAAETPSESWREDPGVFDVNKERAHSTYTPYVSEAEMMADTEFFRTPWVETKSSLRKSLNGKWKFSYSATPEEAPKDFYKTSYNSSSWALIDVPSVWQMHGYDTPMYVNADYPFDKSQCPRIVRRSDNDGYDTNPTGCYLTTFDVPAAWGDKALLLNFEGIYSGAYIWVNGQFVGYTQASNTDHEFDITKYAKQGSNSLAVKVIKWTDGSFIEDQDMMRVGGIFRDVTLTAVPKTFVRDHCITTVYGSGYTSGRLKVQLSIDNRSDEAFTGTAEVKMLAPDGKTVVATLPEFAVSVEAGKLKSLTNRVSFSDVELWSCEKPNLYTIVTVLKDAQGKDLEAFSTKYGFRRIEMKDSRVYINGKQIWFKGVNRQDTDPFTGRMQTTERLLQDVLMFKRFNINTVRTSHCPHAPKMMAMYDHFGIYVMDEADLEAHAMDGALSSNRNWTDAFVDRQERMVLRDRNHPSVIFWSMGNESKNGSNFADCRDAIRTLDDRFVHYEGQEDWSNSDFTSKMYPYEREMTSYDQRWGETRPHFLCEYAHAMGQSLGNFKEYWDYIRTSTRTIGGCIWDWADQAIYDPQELLNGTWKKYEYSTGYDYPGPHQNNFMSNGVVGPEREVTGKLVEVKKVHQWLVMKDFSPEAKSFNLTNEYDFTDANEFTCLWSVSRDGIEVESGSLAPADLAPGSTMTVTVPYSTQISSDAEYLLTLKYVTRQATDWAEAGHSVAEEQFAINERPTLAPLNIAAMPATLQTRGNGPVEISGEGFKYTFDAAGNLVGMVFDGHDYIYNGQGLKFDSYRFIENDAPYNGLPPATMAGYSISSTDMACNFEGGDARGAQAVTLMASFENPGNISYTNYYTVYADGTMDLRTVYRNSVEQIERMGQSVALNPALENLEYFARGPLSNYIDRKTGSFAAVYTSTVTEQHENFVHPQSMSNHEELRYLKLTSPEDPAFGLLIETQGPVSFSALHHTEADYAARKNRDLPDRKEVILHLDYQQKGLGNGSCGSTVWSRFLIPRGQDLTNTLRFTPLRSRGAGYSVPTGTKGAYLTELSAEGFSYAPEKPADLYNATGETVSAPLGRELPMTVKTSKTAKTALWVDFDQNLKFDDSEKMNGTTMVLPADCKAGSYRMRLVIEADGEPKANGPVADGTVYDLTLRTYRATSSEPAKYSTPNGTTHPDGQAYLEQISVKGAVNELEYTATENPDTVYTLVPGTIELTPGRKFTVNFKAHEAGPRSTSESYQDLRYNFATVFVDYANTGYFEKVATIGNAGYKGPSIICNYDWVMDINQQFTVPADAPTGYGRIRIIYENAWTEESKVSAGMQNIYEGIAYDINLHITNETESSLDFTTLPEVDFTRPDGTLHSDGQAYVKRISTSGASKDIDVSWNSTPEFFTLLSDAVEADAGTEFNLRLEANPAGERSSSTVFQDLRYNTATIFTDWTGTKQMTALAHHGKVVEDGDDKVLCNYDAVMDITQPIAVPAGIRSGRYIVRVIYQNAWMQFPEFNATNILEGCAYDIPVIVAGEEDSITEITPESGPGRVYDILGRRVTGTKLRPGLYIVDGVKTLVK